MSGPCEPLAPDSPLFVYGLLKPGELAHPLIIKQYVIEETPGTIRGHLRFRDGLPLFVPASSGEVCGYLLRFDPARTREAWDAVRTFEPHEQYEYGITDVVLGDDQVRAHVLVGCKVNRGASPELFHSWSAASDQVFVEGLAEVAALTLENASYGAANQPDGPDFWRIFFRLQAAYLLLWSVVERYTAFRYGPGLDPGERLTCLDKDPAFQTAVADAGVIPDFVYDSRKPKDKAILRADGTGAKNYFYQVRSNLSHRGKSAFRDRQIVLRALVQLHDAMRTVLKQQVPALLDEWKCREPDGWLLRSRIAPEALGAGRTAREP